jgi:membrane-associated phospholipid phosphatase
MAVVVGLTLLATSLVLGAALRHNQGGTALDRWFQRETAPGFTPPGQPGSHPRVHSALTHVIVLGAGPGLALLLGLSVLTLLWRTAPQGRKPAFVSALVPIVALALAGLSAELILKTAVNRRMVGNLGILTYPSGHAVATASIATATIAMLAQVPGRNRNPYGAFCLGVAVLLLAVSLTVGVAMAVLRAHFATDVLGGWAWGCGWAILISAAAGRFLAPRGGSTSDSQADVSPRYGSITMLRRPHARQG